MDLQNFGYGGGGGILGVILTWFGFKQRLDKMDEEMKAVKESVVYKDVHAECSRAWHDQLYQLNKKMDMIISKLK